MENPHRSCKLRRVRSRCRINAKTTPEDLQLLNQTSMEYFMALKQAGVRVKLDDSDWTSGKKCSHWEMKVSHGLQLQSLCIIPTEAVS